MFSNLAAHLTALIGQCKFLLVQVSHPGLQVSDHSRVGKTLGFLEIFFRFFRFHCTNKTEHKISTQEEYPIHNSLSFSLAFL